MQMEEKLEKMSERLEAMEREYHSDKKVVKVGAAVFVVLLVAFFGISLSQIKSHVDKALATETAKVALEEIENLKIQANAALDGINSLETVDIYQYHATGPTRFFCDIEKYPGPGWEKIPAPVFRAFAAKSK